MTPSANSDSPLLDLIVPIHGQIEMNRVFFDTLARNTSNPFRLIVVDNCSQDRSADFFESQNSPIQPVLVIRNPHNQCYPVSVNQGVRAGSAPIVGLLNNDILVGPGWEEPLVKGLLENEYPVVSPSGLEHFPDHRFEEKLFQRWRTINRRKFSEVRGKNISEKIQRMYGDFNDAATQIQKRYSDVRYPGIMGHCHLLKRETFESLGGLDPRIQSADWDLYLTVEKLKREGKLKNSPMILGASYVHHFIRLTDSNVKRSPVICGHDRHLTIEEKWAIRDVQELWPFKDQVPNGKKNLFDRIRKRLIKISTRLYSWKRDFNRIFH